MTPQPAVPAKTAPPSDAWIPENPGDTLEGWVLDVDTAWSKFRAAKSPDDPDAGFYPLLTVRRDDQSEVKLHAFRTVLYNEIMRKQPIAGERVTVTFVGVGPGRDSMSGAHIYRVKVDGRSGSADAYRGLRPAVGPAGAAVKTESDVPNGLPDESDLPF